MTAKVNWDAMGIATSVLCAIHCALLPVIMTTLPIFGINIIHNSFFEWGMIFLAFCIGIIALIHGFTRHHHSLKPILIFSSGFVFLVSKQFFSSLEYWFLAMAVTLIVSAHIYNFYICHQSKCHSPHHAH